MKTRPDTVELKALIALRAHPGWETVLNYLRKERQALLEHLAESSDTAALHRAQGAAAHIKEFLETADQASSTLEKLEQPKKRPGFGF